MPPPPPRFDPRRRRAVTFALLLVTALASFESTVVSTAMPTIIGDLHGLSLYSWVFSVYLLTSTISMPLFGRLADLYGRRRVLLVATALFLGGALVCALARSMPQLIVARALQGLGAGGLMPVALTVTGDLYSISERAKVQGLFSGVWGFASLIGPLLGAFLTVTFGWRSIFTINLPLGLLAFALVATQMVETREPRTTRSTSRARSRSRSASPRFSSRSSIAQGPTPSDSSPVPASSSLAVTFLSALRPPPEPPRAPAHPPRTLHPGARRRRPTSRGLLLGTSIYGVDTFVPLFVQGARGGSAGAAGAVVTPLVSDGRSRLGWRRGSSCARLPRTALAGALLILAGFAGLGLAAVLDAGVGWISLACGLVGLGLGPSSLSQVLVIQHVVPEERRGVATSLVPFSRTIGGSIGVGALGGILAAGLARRLGPAADSAGTSSTGGAASSPELRMAIERSLLPVFAVLFVLAAVNLLVTARYRAGTDGVG